MGRAVRQQPLGQLVHQWRGCRAAPRSGD
uniref:Uncharacterized protein n=1 Tax=Anopheles dirus TaxID=7168 RepID=A0A182NX54_9DIPT